MSLIRWEPFGEAASMRRAMDRMMDDFFTQPRYGMSGMSMTGFDLDVVERDDALEVSAALPGVKPEDINLSIERNVLTISGESHSESEEKGGRFHHRERRHGRFSRSIMLPMEVDPDACQADFEHGVLTIRLPKAEQARSRRIEVRGGESGRPMIEGQASRPGGRGRQDGAPTQQQNGGRSPGNERTGGAQGETTATSRG
ncbi:MAG: Hsp20/alpha crystallin family protein [Dehalococcoidia bacterium]